MPRLIVRLPDGRFGIWSTKKKNFIMASMHKRNLMRFLLDRIKRQWQPKFAQVVAEAERATHRWEQCLKTLEEVHGKEVRINAEKTNLEYPKWNGGVSPMPKCGGKKGKK